MSAYSDRVLVDNPIGYWRLNEAPGSATGVDSTGHGHTVTYQPGVTLGQAGALSDGSKSAYFPGGATSYATCGATANYAIGTGPMSAECWFNTTFTNAQILFDNSNQNAAAGFQIYLQPAGYVVGAVTNGTTSAYAQGSRSLNDGRWHHAVMVVERLFDGTNDRVRVFIDGQFEVATTVSAAGLNLTSAVNLTLGSGSSHNLAYSYVGALDDVAWYATALTPAQIATHYALRLGYDPYATRVISDGASAYWRLDETSGLVAHDLIAGNNGTISGGVTLGQPGALPGDPAMAFDGVSGKVDIPNGPAIHGFGLGSFTIELWVRLQLSPNYRVAMRSLGTVAGAQSWLQVYQGGDTNLVCSLGDPTNAIAMLAFAIVPQDNQWRHVVYTIARGSPDVCAAYLNGVLVQTNNATISGVDYTFVNELSLGYDYTANGYWCPGALDDIAIYHTALTPAQIATHYALRQTYDPYATKVISDGAVAYWRLDETSGTLAKDLIGGNTGTISGGVTLNQPGALAGDAAMAFDGTGVVTLSAYTFPAGSFSVELWCRVPNVVAVHQRGVDKAGIAVVCASQAGGGGGLPFLYVVASGVVAGGNGTQNICDGLWHALVFTQDGSNGRVYIDGVLNTSTAQVYVSDTSTSMTLGSGLVGRLDEVAIYPTALTPAQIAAHYTAGTTGARPNILLTEGEMESRTPYNYMLPVTPDQDFEHKTSGLYIGAGGDVSIVQANGKTVVFTAAVAGSLLSVQATRVNSAGTTAANLVALFYV
jgi:hypothetical protein